MEIFIHVWFFVVMIITSYFAYQLLKIFDYSKILLKGNVNKLKILLIIIAIIMGFLFASAFCGVIERVASIIR